MDIHLSLFPSLSQAQTVKLIIMSVLPRPVRLESVSTRSTLTHVTAPVQVSLAGTVKTDNSALKVLKQGHKGWLKKCMMVRLFSSILKQTYV